MGIYINGMEMPKSLPLVIVIDAAGTARRYDLNNDRYADNELFEAVSIPPHGDLIDRDEQIERAWRLKLSARELIEEMLKSAPTIIPASQDAKTEEDTEPWLCLSCRHYPPSSTDGKPCSQCNPSDVWHSCYDPAEEGE